ncbi:2-C-methyl-D-erythritol 4-phosphate cytidylyltransferase [Sanguibacter sp. 4.1]|uniref:2-C-methyl-D-erythritol 4-phosphate cytidylyltransferase n=1 Tax=Sanguibacter biliveldensis TaxID=3030830 RepID=A0AAF0Z2T8_9MICO|nr:2-C-methyl-D-erythritol 4-phosphate cytidylyltransferase [Sanguibacter sp. 4.1]WPF81807.1 2-C-methyl-D-erythritol 4-phosphate cytidylyltransferase [Sanguibacter sp. 4.1]
MTPSAVAVLTAAGSGARLGLGCPKALAELAACTLVGHAASRLSASGQITQIVVTAPAAHHAAVSEALSATPGITVPWRVVEGGPSRQASVAAGLAELARTMDPAAPYDVVLVHDAARPLASAALVSRVVAAVREGAGAVVPGLPVTDTIKSVAVSADGPERVTGTVDRSVLRAVQTPQGFAWELLLRAHAAGADRAQDESTAATDDSSLVEALGEAVHVVPGEAEALKITTTYDLAVAGLLLAETVAGADAADTGSPVTSQPTTAVPTTGA